MRTHPIARRGAALSGAALLLLMLLTSCASPVEKADTDVYYTFTDDLQNSVTLSKKPTRVAVLFSSFADVWLCAGGEVCITVGESVERGFARGDAILVDSGAGKTVNTEALLSANPDFVICSADIGAQVKAAELLCGQGIPAACFRIESFEDYLRVLKICTDITGAQEKYQENGIAVKERIDSMLTSVRSQNKTADILFVRASATSVKAKSSKDHFVSLMLSELGAHNIADSAPLLIDGLDGEEILSRNPSHIFVSIMGSEEGAKKALASNTVISSLDATQNGNCHILPKELFQYKPNARWDEAYLYLIELLYENFETNG